MLYIIKPWITLLSLYLLNGVPQTQSQLARGVWSSWAGWSSCQGHCGVGYTQRSRYCYGLKSGCPGSSKETRSCQPPGCSNRGHDPPGGSQGPDSSRCRGSWPRQCNQGRESKVFWDAYSRQCRWFRYGDYCSFTGTYFDTIKECECACASPRPYDCQHESLTYAWDDWESWSPSSCGECGRDRQQRRRSCRQGQCQGESSEYRTCRDDCWSSGWSSWGGCKEISDWRGRRCEERKTRSCRGSCQGSRDESRSCRCQSVRPTDPPSNLPGPPGECPEAGDDNSIVGKSYREASASVGKAEAASRRGRTSRVSGRVTPRDRQRAFRRPTPNAVGPARAAEVYGRSIQIIVDRGRQTGRVPARGQERDIRKVNLLTPAQLEVIARCAGCLDVSAHSCSPRYGQCICYKQPCNCQVYEYRTMDGSCNNLAHPLWGRAVTPYLRILPPDYEDGFNAPKGWYPGVTYNGYALPSPRLVSTELLHTDLITEDESYTHMLMQWGQFLDHDMDFAPVTESSRGFGNDVDCDNDCSRTFPCFPIDVPPGDDRLGGTIRCLGFTRSAAVCTTNQRSLQTREQMNQITAYIDASNVYGSSNDQLNLLRDSSDRKYLRGGRQVAPGKYLLPYDRNSGTIECQEDLNNNNNVPCFLAGDRRVNEQVALSSMHTIWMREHNRLAKYLSRSNPTWDDDTVFEEARKIVIAEMQHITYTEWLPKIIGDEGMRQLGSYRGYDPTVQAAISNEFATAAFRFGHTLVRPRIFRLDQYLNEISQGHLDLHQAFFSPHRIENEGGIDPILRGLFAKPAKRLTPGRFLNDEITNKLFALSNQIALDLASLNIQRGRDHGLPFYNDYRERCGLNGVNSFHGLAGEISDSNVRRILEDLYHHPGNIDLWVGLIAETTVLGARVGKTLRCLLVEQFKRTRDGDRFWYEKQGVFEPDQLEQLRKASLARVICDNSDGITKVQRDVYRISDHYLDCRSLPEVDLRPWHDCQPRDSNAWASCQGNRDRNTRN